LQNLDFPYKQGIQQHICEILEGGEKAFEFNEEKISHISSFRILILQ